MTDWTVDREFIPTFDRVSEEIDFKDCMTPDDICDRIKRKQRSNDFRAKYGITKNPYSEEVPTLQK